MNRDQLRILAEQRILDALALLDGSRWSFAFYASGYAVECALKSCILARMIETGWVFRKGVKIEECLTHKFLKLVDLAGLRDELESELKSSPRFARNWAIAQCWEVDARYIEKTEAEARTLHDAITEDPDGMLPWIKKYW